MGESQLVLLGEVVGFLFHLPTMIVSFRLFSYAKSLQLLQGFAYGRELRYYKDVWRRRRRRRPSRERGIITNGFMHAFFLGMCCLNFAKLFLFLPPEREETGGCVCRRDKRPQSVTCHCLLLYCSADLFSFAVAFRLISSGDRSF